MDICGAEPTLLHLKVEEGEDLLEREVEEVVVEEEVHNRAEAAEMGVLKIDSLVFDQDVDKGDELLEFEARVCNTGAELAV